MAETKQQPSKPTLPWRAPQSLLPKAKMKSNVFKTVQNTSKEPGAKAEHFYLFIKFIYLIYIVIHLTKYNYVRCITVLIDGIV